MRVEFPRLEQKSKEMLDMLTKDSKFKDSTWPATVGDSLFRPHADGGRWILKEQHALDVGIYQQRQTKRRDSEGNEVTITQVKVNGRTDTEMHKKAAKKIKWSACHPGNFSPSTCTNPLRMMRIPGPATSLRLPKKLHLRRRRLRSTGSQLHSSRGNSSRK